MGCGSSSEQNVVVHQNGAAKPVQPTQPPYPQQHPPRQAAAAPPPQPLPPPQSRPEPEGSQQPTTGEVAQEQSPGNPPKPPSPPAEDAPKTDQTPRNPGAPPAPDDEAKSEKVDNQDGKLFFWYLHVLFIRNQFISNLVLDSLTFRKLLELQGKREETLEE